MIDRIIEYSARNRFLVLLLVFFATAAGVWSLRTSPLDAIPDLSDVQVIVFADWPGRSPDIVEDQITYPIITTMIAAPRVKYVRGESMFGYSFVNVVFEDGTDLYWARSRVLEYMQGITGRLPEGVSPRLGPDATGVGWVYEYALVDRSGRQTLADLRSFQDWYLRYWLASVDGVAEVASVGGFVKQYQVEIDPATLLGYRLPLATSSRRSGGRTTRSAAAWSSSMGPNTWSAAGATCARSRTSSRSPSRPTAAGRRSWSATSVGSISVPTSGAGSSSWMATARQSAAWS